jgi:hypothetical protein
MKNPVSNIALPQAQYKVKSPTVIKALFVGLK